MEVINEEINNLQRLVKEFSRFARIPSANFENYDLNDQIRDIIAPYRTKADITLTLDPNLPQYYGDRMQMKQVFVNLIQNAIQATTSRGVIEIISECDDNDFIFSIKDSGDGIPPDDLERIFRPYYTTREKGTGLGLSIVKRMITQHQGTIEVDSKKGKGTTFTIRIQKNINEIEDENEDFSY